MQQLFARLILILISLLLCQSAEAGERLRLATTTSTENSGLLAVLLPPFEKKCGCTVDVIAVGTGKALKLGEIGDVDLVLVHARPLEDAFVAKGFGVNRRDVMYNDFVIIGPADDPARIAGATGPADAFARIARSRAPFVSRGDESGTHLKERELWKSAGIRPSGSWYLETGQGMGEVIRMATERRAYALADRATYGAYRARSDLRILHQGKKELHNPYGVIAVNPGRYPHVKGKLARRFIDYLTGAEGAAVISSFRANGEQLFFTTSPRGN